MNELGWRKKIDLVDDCIEANAKFLKEIVDYPEIFDEGSHRSLAATGGDRDGGSDSRPAESGPTAEDDETNSGA